MTKIILILSLITLEFAYRVDDTIDYVTALTGNGSKSWYLYSRTPDEANSTCKADHDMALDNTYTFSSNGTFEFDHGAVTKDDTCNGEDCCSDFINMVGKWKFTSNKHGLKVTGEYEKGTPSNAQTIVLFDAKIDQLDEHVLKLSQTNPETNTSYSFEFRSR